MKKETISIKEAYRVMQLNCGIGVGDKVRILRTAGQGEMGWYGTDSYEDTQRKYIGKVLVVSCMTETTDVNWICLHTKHKSYATYAPFFVLELVEKAKKPEKMISVDGREYSENTLVKMIQQYSE